ncbi:hypothetical protein C0993_012223, partial [Termitomyces sp. T159_Od127]
MNRAHVLDVLQWDDVLSLLYLSNYFEIYSGLVHWYYPKVQDIRGFEASVKNRMRARQLVLWFFQNHALTSPTATLKGSEALDKIYVPFLAHQAKVLVLYKRKAWKAGLRGDPENLTPKTFSGDIELCLKEGPAWVAYQSTTIESSRRSFSWYGTQYQSERLEVPVKISFPFLDGLVYGDREIICELGLQLRPSVDLTETGAGTNPDSETEDQMDSDDHGAIVSEEQPGAESGASDLPGIRTSQGKDKGELAQAQGESHRNDNRKRIRVDSTSEDEEGGGDVLAQVLTEAAVANDNERKSKKRR